MRGVPMRLILSSLIVLAWTSGPIYGPKPLPPAAAIQPVAPAVQSAAPAIDFDQLRSQAREALDQLRHAKPTRAMTVASVN